MTASPSGAFTRARLTRKGWDEDLVLETGLPVPEPTPGDVVVEVEACGVCFRDLIDREGRFPFLTLPVTPGHEAVGRVVGVGAGVEGLSLGDRVATMHRDHCGSCAACERGDTSQCQGAAHVFGLLVDGGYATHLRAPQRALFRVPDGLPGPEAAVMHCTFGTAWRCLFAAGLRRDRSQRVLVTGANGGVGVAAVQIAARFAREVVAVVRDARHEAFLRELGATRVIVSKDGRFDRDPGVSGVDVALDCVGSPVFKAAVKSLAVGGKIAVVGNVDPRPAELNLGYLIVFGLSIVAPGGATPGDMEALFFEHAKEPFRVVIERTLPLSRADEAQRAVRRGGLEGRWVLVPGSSDTHE